MKKKSLLLGVLAVLMFVLTACSGASEPATEDGSFAFERPIEIVVPFGAGGGSDTTWRAIQPMLEDELGVAIKINNVSGASGVKGAEYAYQQPADGYTFLALTNSHVVAAAKGSANYDVNDEIIPIVKMVHDANVLVAGKDVPYNSLDELVEYAKANPGAAKIGLQSIDGVDAASVIQLFKLLEIEVPLVPFDGGAEANAAVLGGHIDMVLAGPGEMGEYIQSGDFKPLVLMAEQRATSLPELECTGELGIDAYIGPWRGIGAKKGTPEEAIELVEVALSKISEMKEWNEWKDSMSLNDRPSFSNHEEFKSIWAADLEVMKSIVN